VTTDSFNSWEMPCTDTTNERVARTITCVPTHAAISDQVTAARCPLTARCPRRSITASTQAVRKGDARAVTVAATGVVAAACTLAAKLQQSPPRTVVKSTGEATDARTLDVKPLRYPPQTAAKSMGGDQMHTPWLQNRGSAPHRPM
jgi:hypothetical protein